MSDEFRIISNKYKVESHLGCGQWGNTYFIKDIKSGEKNRKKILKNFFYKCENGPDNFIDEIIDLTSLHHSSLVIIYDILTDERGHLCVISEYCSEGDLHTKVTSLRSKGQHLSELIVWEWASQLLLGLNYMHRKGIIHRDIRPKNIFFIKSGIKLGDFGISKVMTKCNEQNAIFSNTPYYSSPEAVCFEGYTYKSDIWSIGCILYEICALVHAFDGPGLMGVIYKIVHAQPSRIPDLYTDNLNNLIHKMLEKDAYKRPSTLQALQQPGHIYHLQRLMLKLRHNHTELRIAMEQENYDSFSQNLRKIQFIEPKMETNKQKPHKKKKAKKSSASNSAKNEEVDTTPSPNAKLPKPRDLTLLGAEKLPFCPNRPRPTLQLQEERLLELSRPVSARSINTYLVVSPIENSKRPSSLRPCHSANPAAISVHEELLANLAIRRTYRRPTTPSDPNYCSREKPFYHPTIYRNRPIRKRQRNSVHEDIYDVMHSKFNIDSENQSVRSSTHNNRDSEVYFNAGNPFRPTSGSTRPNSRGPVSFNLSESEPEPEPEEDNGNDVTGRPKVIHLPTDEVAELVYSIRDTIHLITSQTENELEQENEDLEDDPKTGIFGRIMKKRRIDMLKTECSKRLPDKIFHKVYNYLHQQRIELKNQASEAQIQDGLRHLCLNKTHLSDLFLVDQLVFLETFC